MITNQSSSSVQGRMHLMGSKKEVGITLVLAGMIVACFLALLGLHAFMIWDVTNDNTSVVLWLAGVAVFIVSAFRIRAAYKRGDLG